MSDQLPARPADGPRAPRVVALTAVCIGVVALAAAAFVLSYAGIHAVALQAGVSRQLARGYPVMFDVLLTIVLAAALSLRSAGWPSKLLAWVTLLALLAAGAGADAWHAAGRRLPARPAAVIAAILPWALVLIAFVLLLVMLRHARLRRAAAAEHSAAIARPPWQSQVPSPLPSQPLVPGFAARPAGPGNGDTLRLAVPRQVTAASAADTMANVPGLSAGATAPSPDSGMAIGTDLAPDDASSDETALDPADGALPYPAEPYLPESYLAESYAAESYLAESPAGQPTEADPEGADPGSAGAGAGRADADANASSQDAGTTIGTLSPAPTEADPAGENVAADPEMPVFHRMWSTPASPAE